MIRGFRVQGLGEIAIRCANMKAMVSFYRDLIGLEVLSGTAEDDIVFFRISDGVAGHTCVLALFLHKDSTGLHGQHAPETGARSSLHHLALSLTFDEQNAAMAWYDQHDQEYRVSYFGWIGWRGIFTEDPEGNTVELVAFDPNWTPPG